MNTKPLLSIIVPTYNRGSTFLRESISSALSQSFRNFELLILDDHSTDNTEEVVMSYTDGRIWYYKAERNQGEYWLTNFGMNRAKGEYVTWLHSDDMLSPESLKRRVDALSSDNTLDFVHGDIVKIDEKGNEIEILKSSDEKTKAVYLKYVESLKNGKMVYLFHHTSIMMKRGFFYQAGPFDCSLPFGGDIDWLIRALRDGHFARVPHVLYLYRKHSGARTVTDIQGGVDKTMVRKMIASRYI